MKTDMKALRRKRMIQEGVPIEVVNRLEQHEHTYDCDLVPLVDPERDKVLFRLHQARTALAEAKTLPEIKQIMNVAEAAELYAKRQRLSEEIEHHAYSIKIEAMIRFGEVNLRTPKNEGTRGQLQGRGVIDGHPSGPPIPTLAELGISKNKSSECNRFAVLPDPVKVALIAREIRPVEALWQARKVDVIKRAMALPEGKYRVIYADPPGGITTSERCRATTRPRLRKTMTP